MLIATILGARPQFIKAAPVSKALLEKGLEEAIIHTGQHYDEAMSAIFFEEMGMPEPHTNLGIGSLSHGAQTGQMLEQIEAVLVEMKPDLVLVYGDTNSTLAGALAAVKLGIKIAHVEAGLRSFNRAMPEEHNRVLTDHISDLHFCPTSTAVKNLENEGIEGADWVGDTMYDAAMLFRPIAGRRSNILQDLNLGLEDYILATIHRPSNADDPRVVQRILETLLESGKEVVLPLHPRTRAKMDAMPDVRDTIYQLDGLRIIEPVGYLDMLVLLSYCDRVATDSGGMQKEAYFMSKPCITLRFDTEWVETVETGWSILVGNEPDRIREALNLKVNQDMKIDEYGTGRAASLIAGYLKQALEEPASSS